MSNSAVIVLLAFLATARLTRLVTADYLTRPFRAWVHGKFGTDSKVGYLVTCDWCASIYTGALVALVTYFWWYTGAVKIILLALAASHFTGLLTRLEAAVDDD